MVKIKLKLTTLPSRSSFVPCVNFSCTPRCNISTDCCCCWRLGTLTRHDVDGNVCCCQRPCVALVLSGLSRRELRVETVLNPFKTAVPSLEQAPRDLSSLSPKRDCSLKRVIMVTYVSRHRCSLRQMVGVWCVRVLSLVVVMTSVGLDRGSMKHQLLQLLGGGSPELCVFLYASTLDADVRTGLSWY